MKPFFMASGPDFKQNYSVDTFPQVDLYPLMCLLLNLIPADNNGSLDIVSDLLVEYTETTADSSVLCKCSNRESMFRSLLLHLVDKLTNSW